MNGFSCRRSQIIKLNYTFLEFDIQFFSRVDMVFV